MVKTATNPLKIKIKKKKKLLRITRDIIFDDHNHSIMDDAHAPQNQSHLRKAEESHSTKSSATRLCVEHTRWWEVFERSGDLQRGQLKFR